MTSTDPPTPQSPRLERSAAKVLGANVAALVIGYVASILIARYLGPSSRGLLAAMQAGATVAAVIGAVGVPVAANFLASRDPTTRPALLGNGLAHAALLTAVAVGGAWLLQDELTERFAPGYDPSLWLGAALLVPITLLDYLLSSLMAASGAFGYRGKLIILGRLLSLLATLLFVVAIDGDVAGALFAVAIAQVVMIVGGLWRFRGERPRLSRALVPPTLSYGVRVSLTALLNSVNARFDLIVLAAVAPLSEVGYYAIAQVVAELVLLTPRALGSVLMPTVAAGKGADTLSGRVLRLNGSLSLVAVTGVAILGPLLILYGYGSAFRPAIVPLLILLPGLWLLSAGELVVDALRGRNRPGTVSILSGMEATLTVGLVLLLVPAYGAVGGAIASTCAYACFGLAGLGLVARQDGVPIWSLLVTTRAEAREGANSLLALARRR